MLRDLPLRRSYRSDDHNLVGQFYIPCLSVSSLYQRAVGFFSSSALSSAAKGVSAFLRGGGRMELVASPFLSKDDLEQIRSGYAARDKVEEAAVLAALARVEDVIEQQRLGMLAWLIEHKRLDMKIAVVEDIKSYGLYHEKLGLFHDGQDFVAFTGSPNESVSGLVSNFECIDVFCSWRPEDRERAEEKQENFAKLWEDRTHRLRVYPFPEAARRSLLRFRPETPPRMDPEEGFEEVSVIPPGCPRLPDSIVLRPYQEEARDNWIRNRGRGTFKMATGSGKTITALSTAAKLYDLIGLQALIVICPYRHLVNQWSKECERFGLTPIRCYESRAAWSDLLKTQLYNVQSGAQPFVTVVTTNSTFGAEVFQRNLRFFPAKTILIGDEAHNLGSKHLLESLPPSIGLRLALSATPERWFDEEGTAGILSYFGPVLQPEFTLRDALECGALVPYNYYPVFVTLTNEESEQYMELSRKIGRMLASTSDGDESKEQLTALLMRRARLVGSAENKLPALRELLQGRTAITHALFYCGDGSVESQGSGETQRQVEAICQMLGHDLNIRVDVYLGETPLDEREDLRRRFEEGELQGLVAIRCLDEGVDIPLIRSAFILASSSNPRQFIQRRGRVLRPHPSKKEAEIYDFIVVPPTETDADIEVERRLLRKELQRYVEFADLALNAGEVRGILVDLQRRFGLLGM